MQKTPESLDLACFPVPLIEGNRSFLWIALWMLISALIFRPSLPILPYRAKAALLSLFGASIGNNLVVKPSVHIKYPWFLEIGDNVWIGEDVWFDNPGKIKIGSNVCISQGAYLVTGNHNLKKSTFDFFSGPIEVADRCWICAKAIIPPGSKIEPGTVVPIGSVWHMHP